MDELPTDMKPWLEHKRRADEPSRLDQLRVARGLAAALGLPPESFSIDPPPSAAGVGKLAQLGRGLAAWKVVAVIGALGVAGLLAGRAWPDVGQRSQRTATAAALRTRAELAPPRANAAQQALPPSGTRPLAANNQAREPDRARANNTQQLAANAPHDEGSNATRQHTPTSTRANAAQRLAADRTSPQSPGANATASSGAIELAGRNNEEQTPSGALAEPLPLTAANASRPPAVPGSGLADELRVIEAASQAVDAHDPGGALRMLAARPLHFLQEERDALRIVALCDLGRAAAAGVQRADFERRAPQSPLRLRITAHCGPISANP